MIKARPANDNIILSPRLSQSRFRFLLVRWSVGKLTFLACSTLFLTDQFSGRQCDLVTLVLGKLDPGDSLAWHSLGFEVKEA